MTEFYLVPGGNAAELTYAINLLLKEGWELYGTPYNNGSTHYQAVIKKTENNNDKTSNIRPG